MTNSLLLESSVADLLLTWSDLGHGDWCQVDLRMAQLNVRLGADARHIVFERLARGVAGAIGDTTSVIDGTPVTWVLSLSEKHHSIYVAPDASRRSVLILGAEGSIISRFALTPEERERWERQLRSAC